MAGAHPDSADDGLGSLSDANSYDLHRLIALSTAARTLYDHVRRCGDYAARPMAKEPP